jgi:hypothetical protein
MMKRFAPDPIVIANMLLLFYKDSKNRILLTYLKSIWRYYQYMK